MEMLDTFKALKDLVELDDVEALSGGTYIVRRTNFREKANPKGREDLIQKYPDVYQLLNTKDGTDLVDSAIKQLEALYEQIN